MQQGSDNWTQWRKKGLGSSDAATIMGVSPWKTPYQLWEEKIGIGKPFQGNFATNRGNEMEPKARAAFELYIGDEFPPMVAEHANYPFIRASLDGYNKERNAILEIKCPGKADHDIALSGYVPDKYYPQLQHQILVTGANKAYYYSYDGEKGVTVEVLPDVNYCRELLEAEIAFWDLVQNKIPPKLTDKDAVVVTDAALLELAAEYAHMDSQVKSLQEKMDQVKTNLSEQCTHSKTKIGRITVSREIRKGSIDYTKVGELKGVDLEQYRKEPTSFVTIRIEK